VTSSSTSRTCASASSIRLIALFVGLIPGGIWASDVFNILTKPVTQWLPKGQDKLAYFKLTSPFMVYMKVAS